MCVGIFSWYSIISVRLLRFHVRRWSTSNDGD